MKVKHFIQERNFGNDLDFQINDWLENNQNIQIEEIQYRSNTIGDEINRPRYSYSALVLYAEVTTGENSCIGFTKQ